MTDTPENLRVEPVAAPMVSALVCACGTCGEDIRFDFDDLDQETGRLDPASAFGQCPECDTPFDAARLRFSAWLGEEGSGP